MALYTAPQTQPSLRKQGCFVKLLAMFNLRRRHFRRTLFLLIVLFTVVFILKVEHLISNLNSVHDTSSNLDLRWTLTKVVSKRPHIDVDAVMAKRHFAELGVKLVKHPINTDRDAGGLRNFNIRYFDASVDAPYQSTDFTMNGGDYKEPAFLDHKIDISQVRSDPESFSLLHQPVDASIVKSSWTRGKVNVTLAQPTTQHRELFLVILVISRPNNVLLRQAARKTWGLHAGELGVWLKFVVGREEKWDDIVDREEGMHKDVIVIEEEDTYEYLPNKVLEGMSWLTHQPIKPKYVMKIDDDTYVNLPYLVKELYSGIINSTQILGAISINSTVVRDPGDKWSVSVLDYPFPVFPTYAFGGGYAMSFSAAAAIVDTRSKTFDWLHLEDVYITGILARKSGISHLNHTGFSYWTSHKAKACDFVLDRRITSVNHTEKEFYTLYSGIHALLRSKDWSSCMYTTSLSSSQTGS